MDEKEAAEIQAEMIDEEAVAQAMKNRHASWDASPLAVALA